MALIEYGRVISGRFVFVSRLYNSPGMTYCLPEKLTGKIRSSVQLASGLNNASAAPDAGFEDRKALVLQIREIAQRFPDDIEIQRHIASGTVRTIS
jgi:hypothetical protein